MSETEQRTRLMTVAVRDEAMPRPPRPFHNAFLALLLAISLPATVVMFGVVRSRQLQSTANPRWAKFARGTASNSRPSATTSTARRVSVPNTRDSSLEETLILPEMTKLPEATFTGSVTGRRTFETPVPTRSIPNEVAKSLRSNSDDEVEELPPIIFRPVDEDQSESPANQLVARLEAELKGVRQRLDQLTVQQHGQHEAESLREQQLLAAIQNLNELSLEVRAGRESRPVTSETALRARPGLSLEETTSEDPTISLDAKTSSGSEVPSFEVQLPTPESEPAYDADPSASTPSLSAETPAPLPADVPDSDESAIRIRRSTGNQQPETYSIDIQDADIRQVFAQLSETAEISIVPSAEIQGRISLNLYDVRFEAALNAIIKSRDYVIEREEGILIVRTAEEAARRKHQNRQVVMKIYRPNYVSAAEFNRLIEPLLSYDGRHSVTSPPPAGLSSPAANGSEDVSDQRDTVVVQDVPEVLAKIDQILIDVDVPPLQVQIEAKILRVRLSEGLNHGLDLGQLPCQRDAGQSFAEGGLKHASLSCNVPTFIKSIERLADTSVVTSQRIQVLNRHRAEMLIGDRIGYQSKPGGEVQFMEAGTRLVLRPSISADGFIRMEIRPEHSSATIPHRKSPPRQNTAELTTQVMIRDGATVAIAGLISEQAVETTKRAPLVSAIPIVGAPFRHRKESLQRTELIVLVTPRIVTDCDTDAEGKSLEQITEERAAEFRDQQSPHSRHNLARAHYERAACYLQQGNYVKARQQIDASLRQDKSDLEALRLRNQINQCLLPGSVMR